MFHMRHNFYQGKRSGSWWGFRLEAALTRILGSWDAISAYIPGNPAVVVDNVTGAGSLVAANMVYKGAKPDGLTIGNFIGNLVSNNFTEVVLESNSMAENLNGLVCR